MTISFLAQKNHLQPIPVSPDESDKQSLMALLLKSKLPVASSCQGDGICSKCRVEIVEGEENLTPELELETKTKKRNHIAANNRLACQVFVRGDVKIDTNYW